MRNIRQITALWDTYTDSRATRALYDTYSGEELFITAFQPIRNFYPREVVETNCFRPAPEDIATHIFDETIAEGPRYRFPNIAAGETATHVNDWAFPMFPDLALFRRSYNTETETETESDDHFDADQEVIGNRIYTGRDDLFEESFRTTLFDEGQDGGELEIFLAFYRDVVQRVGWCVYPPLNNITMVNGVAEFLSREPWYARFITPLDVTPEEESYSTVGVTATMEVSRVPYNTETDPAQQTQTSGRIQDVYPGGFNGS